MTEYKDRECLVKEAEAVLKFIEQHYSDKVRIADAKSTVEWLRYYAPAANLVEVVRCKDCKHLTPVEGGVPLCTLHNIGRVYSDFCSDGEKKR